MALIGWFFADLLYRRKPGMADRLVERASGVYSLLVNKYWIDQVYNAVIVTPLLVLAVIFCGAQSIAESSTVASAWQQAASAASARWSNACNPETFVPMQDGWQSAQAPSS